MEPGLMFPKNSNPEESLGIFELDDNGLVVYSNFEGSTGWGSAEKDLQGRNFFSEVLGFTNVSDFQRRLEAFKADALPAQSFDFVCQYHHQSVTVKVLLAQLCDKTDGRPRSIVVHLRRAEIRGRGSEDGGQTKEGG